jgi:hypothetical protein
MFLTSGNKVVADFDLDFVSGLFRLIDTRLDKLDADAEQSPDPDSYGVFDAFEATTGLGFVAAQQYLVATYGFLKIRRKQALDVGPTHTSGTPLVAIINHAANYWKHRGEWDCAENAKNKRITIDGLSGLGISIGRDYVLSSVLSAITSNQARFSALIPSLETWRDKLRQNRKALSLHA